MMKELRIMKILKSRRMAMSNKIEVIILALLSLLLLAYFIFTVVKIANVMENNIQIKLEEIYNG